jgi:two-component system sensor histidine kinase and response regulator WspE
VTLKLPLTLSVVRTLVVEVAGEPYAIPLLRLERLASVRRGEIQTVEDRPYLTLEGQAVGLVPAAQALGLGGPPPQGEELAVVVVADQSRRHGLVVDRFRGEQELVVRPLDERLGRIPGVSAAAVLPDGSPTVILDVEDLIHHLDQLLAQGKPAKVGGAGREAPASVRAKRVLVVDDSLTVREVERRLLENAGYQVVTAVDGQEGWSQIRTGQFDLVVTDVDMPRLDGLALTAMIKADEQLKPTPVVIVSYKDNEAYRLRGLTAGANYYLTKSSFQDEGLVRAVADLIGEARP